MAQGPSVTLKNKTRRMLVLNLPYQIVGSDFMKRQLTGSLRYNGKTGEKKLRGGMKRVSDSVTLLSKGREGSEAIGLPPAVVRCPDVAAAIKAGEIEVVQRTAEETAAQRKQLEQAGAAREEAAAARKAWLQAKQDARAAAALEHGEKMSKGAPAQKPSRGSVPRKHAPDAPENG